MPPTLIRIEPGLPLCWEDEHTLRFGFDRAELRIPAPSASEQRLLGALLSGVRSDRFGAVLRRLGVRGPEWAEFASTVESVLRYDGIGHGTGSEAGRGEGIPSVAVSGAPASAAPIRQAFAAAGFGSSIADENSAPPELIVALERFVPAPAHSRFASECEPPRLTIRFGDRNVDVGPLRSAPGDPCSGCLALAAADADRSMPMLAAQLIGTVPAGETPAAAEFAAGLAVMLTRHWIAGREEPGRVVYRFPVRDGLPLPRIEELPVAQHPECGCALTEPERYPLRR